MTLEEATIIKIYAEKIIKYHSKLVLNEEFKDDLDVFQRYNEAIIQQREVKGLFPELFI